MWYLICCTWTKFFTNLKKLKKKEGERVDAIVAEVDAVRDSSMEIV